MSEILDSGERVKFDSGAVRDIKEGKGRMDLVPLSVVSYLFHSNQNIEYSIIFSHLDSYIWKHDPQELVLALNIFIKLHYNGDLCSAILDVSKHYESGALKYGERNWEKGIPLHSYVDSACRHLIKCIRGDTDENHVRAFMWNLLGAMWTQQHHPECMDLPEKVDTSVDNL